MQENKNNIPSVSAKKPPGGNIDLNWFQSFANEKNAEYRDTDPYPHIVIDNFISADQARVLAKEIEELLPESNYFRHFNSKKYACNDLTVMGPNVKGLIEQLQSEEFVGLVSKLSGIKNLISDPTMDGGGVHMIAEGGFLNVHTDFLSHTKFRSWRRQINILVYLNDDWKDEYNGKLELWDASGKQKVKSIAPVLGRCVIFSTIEKSYHGHPIPLNIPEGMLRKSIALYYFVDEGKNLSVRPTDYINLPEDGRAKVVANKLDRAALQIISLLKRYLGLSNGGIGKLLKKFFG